MYFADGIAYASEPTDNMSITEVRVVEDYILIVRFSTGEYRLYDAKNLLQYPAFQPLTDKEVFNRVKVAYGTLVWDDGDIDIAPETVYKESFEYVPLKDVV